MVRPVKKLNRYVGKTIWYEEEEKGKTVIKSGILSLTAQSDVDPKFDLAYVDKGHWWFVTLASAIFTKKPKLAE